MNALPWDADATFPGGKTSHEVLLGWLAIPENYMRWHHGHAATRAALVRRIVVEIQLLGLPPRSSREVRAKIETYETSMRKAVEWKKKYGDQLIRKQGNESHTLSEYKASLARICPDYDRLARSMVALLDKEIEAVEAKERAAKKKQRVTFRFDPSERSPKARRVRSHIPPSPEAEEEVVDITDQVQRAAQAMRTERVSVPARPAPLVGTPYGMQTAQIPPSPVEGHGQRYHHDPLPAPRGRYELDDLQPHPHYHPLPAQNGWYDRSPPVHAHSTTPAPMAIASIVSPPSPPRPSTSRSPPLPPQLNETVSSRVVSSLAVQSTNGYTQTTVSSHVVPSPSRAMPPPPLPPSRAAPPPLLPPSHAVPPQSRVIPPPLPPQSQGVPPPLPSASQGMPCRLPPQSQTSPFPLPPSRVIPPPPPPPAKTPPVVTPPTVVPTTRLEVTNHPKPTVEDAETPANPALDALLHQVEVDRLQYERRAHAVREEQLQLELARQQIHITKEKALARHELRLAGVPEHEIDKAFPLT